MSSKGDTRFSPLFAKLKDGRKIEEAYQLDVKGYRKFGNNWKIGKGKEPLIKISSSDLWEKYLSLWREWAIDNKNLMDELIEKTQNKKILKDRFASTEINQARALCKIINDDLYIIDGKL